MQELEKQATSFNPVTFTKRYVKKYDMYGSGMCTCEKTYTYENISQFNLLLKFLKVYHHFIKGTNILEEK